MSFFVPFLSVFCVFFPFFFLLRRYHHFNVAILVTTRIPPLLLHSLVDGARCLFLLLLIFLFPSQFHLFPPLLWTPREDSSASPFFRALAFFFRPYRRDPSSRRVRILSDTDDPNGRCPLSPGYFPAVVDVFFPSPLAEGLTHCPRLTVSHR